MSTADAKQLELQVLWRRGGATASEIQDILDKGCTDEWQKQMNSRIARIMERQWNRPA